MGEIHVDFWVLTDFAYTFTYPKILCEIEFPSQWTHLLVDSNGNYRYFWSLKQHVDVAFDWQGTWLPINDL